MGMAGYAYALSCFGAQARETGRKVYLVLLVCLVCLVYLAG